MDSPQLSPADHPSHLPVPGHLGPNVQPIRVLGQLPQGYFQPPPPPGRKVLLPALLFVLTGLSTYWAGAHPQLFFRELPNLFINGTPANAIGAVGAWRDGWIYMLCVMGMLLAHEMGHFLQCLRYRVPASLPFFIPMPFSPIGTMGAVISMEGSSADRKQLFDIGISGPLAGLVVALPLVWIGIQQAIPVPPNAITGDHFQDPLLFKILISYLHPNLAVGQELRLNPILMAGWVGMLITGLNMFPIAQLDGGHVSYALFGPRGAGWLARAVLVVSILYMIIFSSYTWILMLILIAYIGVDHPPTANDRAHLGWGRRILGLLCLLIPILCFTPNPITMAH
ncbi:MAG TPA: site-2 protease family protein [Pirellulales bacterium]|jgi:membrane-associated protease RseP (regulator of RpoE activity)